LNDETGDDRFFVGDFSRNHDFRDEFLQQQRRHVSHTSRARERLVELPTARKDARRSRSRATTEPHVLDLVDILLGADALGYVEARPFREKRAAADVHGAPSTTNQQDAP